MAGPLDVGFAAGGTKMTRRDFLKGTGMMGAACLVAPLLSSGSHSDNEGYGTIIRNGTVYDDTLGEPIKADVGIVGDRIVAVGNLSGSTCKVIDAQNCIITPGFIDVHDHSDLMFLNAGADTEEQYEDHSKIWLARTSVADEHNCNFFLDCPFNS